MTKDKNYNAIMDCYITLYENSEPKADFKELIGNAPINEFGEKVINFMDYVIDEVKFNQIVNNIIKKYKYKGYQKQLFKNTIILGCSPKFKS